MLAMVPENADPSASVPPTPSFRLRPLAALLFAWVGLVGVRTFAFTAWHGTGSLFALAMLDLSALFLATIAFVVLPLSMRGLGVLVLALGFGLPLAGVGWFLETTVSPDVSLLGAFVGLHALAAGGIAGAVWTRTEFFGFALLLCLGFGAGGIYGAAEQTSWPDAALLLAPLTLVGWGGAAAMWRPTAPPPTTV